MNERVPIINVATHRAVNDLPFGAPADDLLDMLGTPDEVAENYTGELEMRYVDTIYRFFANRFVECTFPASHRFVIDGVAVLSVFEWLRARTDVVDKARFRISLAQGMAYDFRNHQQGSLTIFEPGRWDALVLRD